MSDTIFSTIHERFNSASGFSKPTVLTGYWPGSKTSWLTVGPGHFWLGCEHATFEEAIKEAIDGHKQG